MENGHDTAHFCPRANVATSDTQPIPTLLSFVNESDE